jgi:site-specific recombinase XerC
MTIVRSLCEWLVRRHYLDSNPWDDVPQRADAPSMPSLRALSTRQWAHVLGWLDAQPPCPATARLRFLMRFASMTGLRLAELSAAKLGWLRHEPLDDGEMAWSIMVLGKRNKWREVPLPDAAVEALLNGKSDVMVGIVSGQLAHTHLPMAILNKASLDEDLIRIARILSI